MMPNEFWTAADVIGRKDAEIARLTAALEDERGMVEGKSRYERVAAKYRNALEERDTARAEVAMALEVAASMIGDNMRHAAELGREIWPIPDIRTLTPAHATEALATDRKAVREKALREAMAVCLDPDDRGFILAMIEKEDAQ